MELATTSAGSAVFSSSWVLPAAQPPSRHQRDPGCWARGEKVCEFPTGDFGTAPTRACRAYLTSPAALQAAQQLAWAAPWCLVGLIPRSGHGWGRRTPCLGVQLPVGLVLCRSIIGGGCAPRQRHQHKRLQPRAYPPSVPVCPRQGAPVLGGCWLALQARGHNGELPRVRKSHRRPR